MSSSSRLFFTVPFGFHINDVVGGGGMECRVVAAANLWVSVGGGGVGQIGGGFSHESEHDLALMVSDFLENGSSGAESWCSSDSDSGLSDFAHLAEKIQVKTHYYLL